MEFTTGSPQQARSTPRHPQALTTMEGAAIAAANRRARKKFEPKKALNPSEHLEALIDIPPTVFISQIDRLDEILRNQKAKRLFGADPEPQDQAVPARQIKMLDGLIAKVSDKIRRSSSYSKLGATSIFFVIYVCCLFLQRDIFSAYTVESSFVNNIVSKLPTTGSGGYFNSGTGATGVVSSSDDVYDWLRLVLTDVFSDPVCGDGECTSPDEYPGFGRFGCKPDCGHYLDTTSLTLDLETLLDTSPDNWNLRTVPDLEEGADTDPGFTYNIYSETMGDFLFAEDLTNTSVTFEVPDGKLSLHLYQTSKVSSITDAATISEALYLDASTLPERSAESDFAYGDPRELLAVSGGWVAAMNDYCWGRGISAYMDDVNCLFYVDVDAMFLTLGGYGFQGTVTMSNKSSTGTASAVVTLADVKFCGTFNDTSTANHANNVATLQESAVSCASSSSSSSRRRGTHAGGGGGGKAQGQKRSRSMTGAVSAVTESSKHREQRPEQPRRQQGGKTAGKRKGVGRPKVASPFGQNFKRAHRRQDVGPGGPEPPSRKIVDMSEPAVEMEWCCDNFGPSYRGYVDLEYSGFWGTVTVTNTDDSAGSFIAVSWSGFPSCDGDSEELHGEGPHSVSIGPSRDGYSSYFIEFKTCSENRTHESTETVLSVNVVEAPRISFAATLMGYSNNTMADAEQHWKSALVTSFGLESRTDRVEVDDVLVQDGSVVATATVFLENTLQLTEWKHQLEEKAVSEADLASALASVGGTGGVSLVEDDSGSVSISWLVGGTLSGRFEYCSTHYDCLSDDEETLFCASWGTVGVTPSCEPCDLCRVDADHTYDGGQCPQDVCPGSGGVPKCMDGADLVDDMTCRDSYSFEVWSYTAEVNSSELASADFVEPAGFSRTGDTTGRYAPTVKPPSTTKARFLTPFNRLVGAIVITQERSQEVPCSGIASDSVHNYTEAGGVTCPGGTDASPYGFDPTFMSSSSTYNGKLRIEDFYADSERHSTVSNEEVSYTAPYGFFPHSYDQIRHQDKSDDEMWTVDKEKFKLYLDERLTQSEAMAMLQKMTDGKFIDSQTKKITVEFVTFNADKNIFSVLKFHFDWATGGTIPWDFELNTLSVDLYQGRLGTVQAVLEYVILLMFVVNVLAEVHDALKEVRAFNLFAYIANPFNWVDWTHFTFTFAMIVSWIVHRSHAESFEIEGEYAVLQQPEAQAKVFATSAANEKMFLQLLNDMQTISNSMATYSTFAGISVVLFVFRILKGLDFQERMGLVTRTIQSASSDLAHFFVLFAIVFFGYAVVGTLLFGHQFEGMATVGASSLTLMVFLLSFDSTQFYASMSHAATEYAFHLFLWSFLIIAFFILLNIFLAILVDAYASVKQETEDARGLPQELAMVTLHGVKRVFWPKKWFVSDQALLVALKKLRSTLSSPISVQEHVRKTLAHKRAVLLPEGVEIDNLRMAELVAEAMPASLQPSKSFKNKHGANAVHAEQEATDEDENSTLGKFRGANNEIVHDLMRRYGEDMSDRMEQRDKEVLELMELENLKRTLAIFTAQSRMIREQKRVVKMMEGVAKTSLPAEVWEGMQPADAVPRAETTGRLHVELMQGEGLPYMDMLRACDPYAVMYIDGVDGDHNVVHTSEWRRRSTAPMWNEKFEWETSDETTTLTVTIWDKDNVSQDDIIGCCYIDLAETRNAGWVERWYALENPQIALKLKNARIKLRTNHVSASSRPTTATTKFASGPSDSEATLGRGVQSDDKPAEIVIEVAAVAADDGQALSFSSDSKIKPDSSAKVSFAGGVEGEEGAGKFDSASSEPPSLSPLWTRSMKELLE